MSLKDAWLEVKDKAAVVMLSSPLWNGSSVYTRIPEGADEKAVEKVLKFFEDLVNEEPTLFKVVFLGKEGEVLATWEKAAEQLTVGGDSHDRQGNL